MRESIGGTWTMQIVIVFILFFVAFITLTINYTRAFKVKNEIISIIEREDGFTFSGSQSLKDGAGARELIASYLLNSGYSTKGRCDEGWYGVKSIKLSEVNSDTSYQLVDANHKGDKYYYCVQKIQVPVKGVKNPSDYNYNNRAYYKVRLFFKFSIPIVGDVTTFKVEGESLEVYFNGDGLKLISDGDKTPKADVTTCPTGYTLVNNNCKDKTAPTEPKMQLYNPIVNSSVASYCLKFSGSSDATQVTYQAKIDGSWKTCGGGSCCFSLADASANYTVEGRACDTSNNCTNATKTININPSRLYIWQVYQYMRADDGNTIIGQPSEKEVNDNLSNKTMAQNVKNMYSSPEANKFFGDRTYIEAVQNFYLGILGRNYDEDGLEYNVNVYNTSGKAQTLLVFVNSKEAQNIYQKWGMSMGNAN